MYLILSFLRVVDIAWPTLDCAIYFQGYCLFYESMLPCVLQCRDKWLLFSCLVCGLFCFVTLSCFQLNVVGGCTPCMVLSLVELIFCFKDVQAVRLFYLDFLHTSQLLRTLLYKTYNEKNKRIGRRGFFPAIPYFTTILFWILFW